MGWSRRELIKGLGIGLLASSSFIPRTGRAQESCRRVSGAGSYAIGPFDPVEEDGEPVYIMTDLGFDETMVFCKVTTNFTAFRFPTASMGTVDIGAHEFFMDMRSTRIASLRVDESEGIPVAVYSGVLRSETRLFSGDNMQTLVEEATFGCRARQLSPATIEASANNFVMTANFAPGGGHAAVFGEEATFAGQLEQGNIIITL